MTREADPTQVTAFSRQSESRLSERQLVDYRSHREQYIQWMCRFGKDPSRSEGYAQTTVQNHAHRTDRFYRWVWDEEGGYTTDVTHDHGNSYLTKLAYEDWTDAHLAKEYQALKALFRWREYEHGWEQWDPVYTFYETQSTTNPRDFLTREERGKIRQAALEYGAIPSYSSLTEEERDRWKAYLAQRFEKPKEQVGPEDWDRANSWKIPSLVSVSLDTGLRPIEVERARTSWVDIENCVLRIPKADSSKNQDNWTVSIQQRTAEYLDRWLEQRPSHPVYDDTDALWLTRQGNSYGSSALRRILHDLCDIAGISYENRQMSWYTIRHSVGTYMAREEGLGAAQMQLRHKHPETTMKYDQAPVEDRRSALDRMG